MPHMIGKDRATGWPLRDGTQTRWMREHDIERAYRDRFDRRRADEVALAALVEHAADQVDLEQGRWLVGVARPSAPIPSTVASPSAETARGILSSAAARYSEFRPDVEERLSASAIGALEQGLLNPRVGLRRWVFRTAQGPADRSRWAYAELLHDGSIVLAGVLEERVHGDVGVAGDHVGLGHAIEVDRTPRSGSTGTVKGQFDVSGRPMSRLSTTRASKNDRARRGASNTMVRETSICRIESSHQ